MHILQVAALVSILVIVSSCTISVRSETKQNEQELIIDKEIFVGPKIGKQ